MRFGLTVLLFLLYMAGFSQTMRIGIFSESNVKSISLQLGSGNYFIMNDTGFVKKILPNEAIIVSVGISKKVDIKINGVYYQTVNKIVAVQEKHDDYLKLKPISPGLKERTYEGDFEFTNRNGKLTIVNVIDIDQYLEGVVESESGTGQNVEYYKAQTVISRTYALKYSSKHEDNGYNLCDRVHCQAYLHRRITAHLIDTAVRQTRGMVMYDSQNNLYPTFFHANCGGQICEPDHVWNEVLPDFMTFKDTFCVKTRQANWEKRIPKKEWTAYMVNKFDFPIWDSVSVYQLYHFQQTERQAFFIHPFYGIPLRDVREAFQLKSTFFSVGLDGDFVVLSGKGFGHGVGLCQEGAMNMSKKGFDFRQILKYYYPGMRLEKVGE